MRHFLLAVCTLVMAVSGAQAGHHEGGDAKQAPVIGTVYSMRARPIRWSPVTPGYSRFGSTTSRPTMSVTLKKLQRSMQKIGRAIPRTAPR